MAFNSRREFMSSLLLVGFFAGGFATKGQAEEHKHYWQGTTVGMFMDIKGQPISATPDMDVGDKTGNDLRDLVTNHMHMNIAQVAEAQRFPRLWMTRFEKKSGSGEASDQGKPKGNRNLGDKYARGQSVQQGDAETPAMVQLRKAAEQGDVEAQFNLAKAYFEQGLTPETEQKAAKLLRKIAIDLQEEFFLPTFMLLEKMRQTIRREYPYVSDAALKNSGGSFGVAIALSGSTDAGIDAAIREALLLDAAAQIWLEISYASDANVSQYDPRILKYFKKMASEKLPRASMFMGRILINGWGVPKDNKAAIGLYKIAADRGFSGAQNDLGVFYSKGIGVPQDYAAAIKWYELAAEQDNALSQVSLGFMYESGQGVQQDFVEAVKWYRKAAALGNASAFFNLGNMYRHGKGVQQDDAEAAKWYRKAAEQDFSLAQSVLGVSYLQGQGVPQDYAEAEKWIRKAAAQGNAVAQFHLGNMYEYGKGVQQDDAEALKWYRLAAEQELAEAEFSVGFAYTHGVGTEQDYGQALVWYRRAAKHGSTDAMNNLSLAYAKERGVKEDKAEVFRWARMAAERGHIAAQAKMLVYYMSGIGVQKDMGTALAWGIVAQKRSEGEELGQLVNALSENLKGGNLDQYRAAINLAEELYRQYGEPYED
jgi:TPR repeat protein